ncbi:hypothetical protein MXD61_04205 [Frankia sp. AgPm24]|nr:hypothetical protein [Frankia sp. AgPm24]MCK9921118.1 hypothetical protein [Frankia sp. AgPm24]
MCSAICYAFAVGAVLDGEGVGDKQAACTEQAARFGYQVGRVRDLTEDVKAGHCVDRGVDKRNPGGVGVQEEAALAHYSASVCEAGGCDVDAQRVQSGIEENREVAAVTAAEIHHGPRLPGLQLCYRVLDQTDGLVLPERSIRLLLIGLLPAALESTGRRPICNLVALR